jgi:hypothetical protein
MNALTCWALAPYILGLAILCNAQDKVAISELLQQPPSVAS